MNISMLDQPYFASCPKHFELLLKDELMSLGAVEVNEALAGVFFQASPEAVMRMIMWSRLANRFYRFLHRGDCRNQTDLYDAIQTVDWYAQVNDLPKTLSIRFAGTNKQLKNTHFSSQVCKDAICDQLGENYGKRPQVIKKGGHLSIFGRLKSDRLDIFQDLTGHSLHLRGYRQENTLAPLKENLAAAILIRAGWYEKAQLNYNLIDPMCGSGTLLLEGWQIACDMAPNAQLMSHALFSWCDFSSHQWVSLQKEAADRLDCGVMRYKGQIIGVDHHKESIDIANDNLSRLPANKRISFNYRTLDKFRITPHKNLIVCNPPYGIRLKKNHLQSWQRLSHWLTQQANGAQAAILTPNAAKGWMVGYREQKSYVLFNGALPVQLRMFSINKKNRLSVPDGQYFSLPAGAQSLANRLKKKLIHLREWVEVNEIEAYRLYDADMPEFAFAIDIYKDFVVIQEYQAPKSIDVKKVKTHLEWALLAVQSVLGISDQQIHLKTRQKQKQTSQYEKQDQVQDTRLVIREHGRKYFVDLTQYLDTGLFLDHRWLRNHIQKQSKGLSVLNLFSYTGTISVAAAFGGARSVTSVDTSRTYLGWSVDNFNINKLKVKHNVVRQDVLPFLQSDRNTYDLIIVDPPTYSNSHSRVQDWDVQRDHARLLKLCLKKLTKDGTVYFSNNFKKFKLDDQLVELFSVNDITVQSLDKDFEHSKIHCCYELKL